MTDLNPQLENEAIAFHQSLFGRKPDARLVQRYVEANRVCFPGGLATPEIQSLQQMVKKNLDIEAIELVFRHRQRDNPLSKKIQILFYLIEVRSEYLPYFFSPPSGRISAWFTLVGASIRTLIKWVWGKFLVRRYSLV